jgi:hypothetical protein
VLESHTEAFSIQGKCNCALIHIQANSKYSILLKFLAIGRTAGIGPISELAEPIESKPNLSVAEGRVEIYVSLNRDSNFQLIFSSGISVDFPVVDSPIKGLIG